MRSRSVAVAVGLAIFLATGIALDWNRLSHVPDETAKSSACPPLDVPELRLERAGPITYLDGRAGSPWLCLWYVPTQDTFVAEFSGVDTIDDFRAAKLAATRRLRSTGFDPCRAGLWLTRYSSPPKRSDDIRDVPAQCTPRVVAADPEAERWLPDVQAAAVRAAAATAADMDLRPTRPLTIVVATDSDSAIAAHQRYVLDMMRAPPEYLADITAHYAQLARTGTSNFQSFSAVGSLVLLNLSRALIWDPSPETMRVIIERGVAHEYTHFAQRAILGEGRVPGWFEEGQAVYQSARQAGGGYANLMRAAGVQRDGTALRLSQLTAATEQHVHEGGDEGVAVYGRGHAAVTMLAERFGYPATVQLLRDNRDATEQHFQELLAGLTGMDLATLDEAVGAWLVAPGRVVFRDDFATPSGYWPARSDDKVQKGYKGSEYAIAKLAGVAGEQWGPLAAWLGDFDADIDVRLMPPTEGGLVSLEFSPARSTTIYRYEVNPTEGAFALLQSTRPEWTTVIDWTQAPAIERGAAVNRLAVRVRRGEIILRANGQDLARTDFDTVPDMPETGSVVATVAHREDGWAEARFSLFVVTNAD